MVGFLFFSHLLLVNPRCLVRQCLLADIGDLPTACTALRDSFSTALVVSGKRAFAVGDIAYYWSLVATFRSPSEQSMERTPLVDQTYHNVRTVCVCSTRPEPTDPICIRSADCTFWG